MASKYMLTSLDISIHEPAATPVCSSCHRPMLPQEHGVEFFCPNCGKAIIRRCKRCRQLGIPYECPSCGFRGP